MHTPEIGDPFITSFGEFKIIGVKFPTFATGLITIEIGPDIKLDYFLNEIKWNENPGCWVVK